MSIIAVPSTTPAYVPLRLAGKTLPLQILAVMLASGFLAACSWISVPMVPVPITLQTFGVTLVGAVFGWRLGGLAVLAWLAEGALGFPVLSGGASGLLHFAGPTGGYLAAFPIVAALVGFCAERGATAKSLTLSFGVMLLANALILGLGAAWLATFVGATKAVPLGVTPFIIGGIVKAGLASCLIEAARRHIRV